MLCDFGEIPLLPSIICGGMKVVVVMQPLKRWMESSQKIGIQTTITHKPGISQPPTIFKIKREWSQEVLWFLHSCDTTFSNGESLTYLTWIDPNGSLAPTSTYTLNEIFTLQRFNHLGSTFGGLGGLGLGAAHRAGQPGCPVTGRNQPGTDRPSGPFTIHSLIDSFSHSFVRAVIHFSSFHC